MTSLSPHEIRIKGLEALAEALGPVGMIRFLQQFDLGTGDYSKDRGKWLDDLTIDEIVDHITKE